MSVYKTSETTHYVAESGAKSSGQVPPYSLIPWRVFAARLATRYGQGAATYGEGNAEAAQ